MLPAETAEEPQSDGQGIGEDALDVHVASRAGIQRQRGAPPPPQMRRGGDLRPREVIAVGQPHRRQKGLQRLPRGKAAETDTARTARLAGRRHESGVTDLLRAQQPQGRKITVRQVHAREGDAPGAAFQPAALEGHLRQVEVRLLAVEVGGGLDGTVEKGRIGHEQFPPLLAFGIGIVFVAGVLGRRRTRKQKKQQGTTAFQHIFATLQNTKIAKSPTIQNRIACSAAKRSGKQKSRRDTAEAASDGDGA